MSLLSMLPLARVPVTHTGPAVFPSNPVFLSVVQKHYEPEIPQDFDLSRLTTLRPPLPWEPKPHDPQLALKLVSQPYTSYRDEGFADATLEYLQKEYFRFRPDEKTKRVPLDPNAKCFKKWFGKKKTVVLESVIDRIEKNWRVDEDLLAKGSFAEVYKHVFGIDVVDLIKNDQLYRWNSLLKGVFGVAKWAAKNAFPLFAVSAAAYAIPNAAVGSGQTVTGFISENYSMGALLALGLLPFIGLKSAPWQALTKVVQGARFVANKIVGKIGEPLSAIGAAMRDEQPHYFRSKFLGIKGIPGKYAKVAFKHGQQGVELELEKDFEKPYLWQKRRQDRIAFRKEAKSETSALNLAKLFTGLQDTLLSLTPAGPSQTFLRVFETMGTLIWVVSLGIALNQGKIDPAFIGSLAAAAGMGAIAANVANNHVENTRKFNKALAKIYRQSFSFAFALAAILSVQDTNFGMVAYGGATLGATALVIGATHLLTKDETAEDEVKPRVAA